MVQTDNQPLEAIANHNRNSRSTLILIDHGDALFRLTQFPGPTRGSTLCQICHLFFSWHKPEHRRSGFAFIIPQVYH
jgi:hypothetical protein